MRLKNTSLFVFFTTRITPRYKVRLQSSSSYTTRHEVRDCHFRIGMWRKQNEINYSRWRKKCRPAYETRKSLYLAFIIPHFNYCSETWHCCNKNATAKLEKVNERALRFVFNEKQTPYCELLDKIGLPSLVNQRLAKIVCTVFKVINSDHAPKGI